MTSTRDDEQLKHFDVAVIGGGAAGLSGAVALGRARRSVVVIDSGEPRNAPADGVHMFLTRDGISPAEFLELGRQEVATYGGHLINAEAVAVRRTAEGFEVSLNDGGVVAARKLLITTGLVDELPDVPGIAELWGRDVHHCPYCHGYELLGQSVGVLGSGPRAVHQALMFRQWVDDLVLFVHTAPELTADEREQLSARGIRIVAGSVDSLDFVDAHLTGVRMADGTLVACQSLVVAPRFVARSLMLQSLGLTAAEHPMGMGEYIPADPTGLTEIPGVWVAGNVTDLAAGVVVAASGGTIAAGAVNAELIVEDTVNAVATYRQSRVSELADASAR